MTDTLIYNGFPKPRKQAYARWYYLKKSGKINPNTRFVYDPKLKLVPEKKEPGSQVVMTFS
jgi:hypothetical protein